MAPGLRRMTELRKFKLCVKVTMLSIKVLLNTGNGAAFGKLCFPKESVLSKIKNELPVNTQGTVVRNPCPPY